MQCDEKEVGHPEGPVLKSIPTGFSKYTNWRPARKGPMHLSSSQAKIYVAGHRGMVGRAVWHQLEWAGYANLVGRTSDELDLRDPYVTR